MTDELAVFSDRSKMVEHLAQSNDEMHLYVVELERRIRLLRDALETARAALQYPDIDIINKALSAIDAALEGKHEEGR